MLLTDNEIEKLQNKIALLETFTSAEIKIVFCKSAWFGIVSKAKKVFQKLNMDKTSNRNAVLILIVEKDKELLIYGDQGINTHLNESYWSDIRDDMIDLFKSGQYYTGLSIGVEKIAQSLIQYFPIQENDINEVSNEIVFL